MVVGSPTKLNLIPSGVMPVVYINQGDAGYDKEFLIYNGDSPYNVPAGVSATIRGKKADGYGVTEAAALTTGSNLVTVTITEQMVAAAGANLYELVFVDTDGLRIATINMVWAVKADALGDSVISDSDLDYATTVMNQLQSVQAFKNQLDTNTNGLAAETAARIAADDTERAARIAADNTLQANINAEASTRAATDASLQSQINQLVAPTGSAPSAAEVQNARIGADGVTYSTLGDAIRAQDTRLEKLINADFKDPFDEGTIMLFNRYNVTDGFLMTDGSVRASTTLCYTNDYIPVIEGKTIYFSDNGNPQPARFVTAYDSSKAVLTSSGLDYGTTYTVPSGVAYIRVSFLKSYTAFQGQYDAVGVTKSYYVLKDTALPASVLASMDEVYRIKANNEELSEMVYNTEDVTIANDGDVVTQSPIGTAQRWFYPDPVPAGLHINTIGFTVNPSYVSNNTPFDIEFFGLNNGTLTLKKSISEVIPQSAAGTYYTFDCDDYRSDEDTYIAFGQGRSMLSYSSGGSMLYIADRTSTTLSFSSLSTFGGHLNVDILCYNNLPRFSPKSANVIEVGDGLDYDDIQTALDSVEDSAANPYVFIIYPKATPYTRFSMIRKLSESYPWSNAPIRYISMVGVDRYRCVIEDDRGDYSTPPAEILTNGIIKNLTFKATKTNQSATATQGAYAVHIDAEPVGNVGYNMVFENCTFESDQTAGVGVGLHNNCHLTFKNCEFISTAAESYMPHEGYTNLAYLGAFNCHSSTKTTDANQVVEVQQCTAISKEDKAYTLSTNANCYMTLKAYGSTFWCEGTNQANGYKGSYCTIYGANHGNNAAALNA